METATDALEQIREGGARLILSAQQKIGEVRDQIEHGNFTGAHTSAEQLIERISHLAAAQARLGRVADSSIVAASELCVGDVTEGGEITGIDPCPCENENCEKRLFTFSNGGQVVVPPEAEFVVGAE